MKAKRTSARLKQIAARRVVATQMRPARARAAATKTKSAATPKRPGAKRPVAKQKIVRRKPLARKSPVVIPLSLLEGDHPTATVASGPGEKYALGPTPPEQHFEPESTELPESYGTKRLYLTARDPHWLYANWDLTREQQVRNNRQSADGHLILRIYPGEGGGPISEIHVHPESRHWFAHVERAATKYTAEIGFYRKGRNSAARERRWTNVATSNAALTPQETISANANVEFATIPVDMPFEQLLALIVHALREDRSLAQAIEELRRAGHPELPPVTTRPAVPWTPEQERALAKIVSLDQGQRVWIGSLEITELVRRQLEREISSISVTQFGWPTSPGGTAASPSSPFGGEQVRGKGFWFNVNAELIVYGATERDASVSIGGRNIKLRPDGSFAYRFALPDGRYDLPVVAVSADETDGRAAELKFTRTTEFLGDVGAQPQDPGLKPPTPDNV